VAAYTDDALHAVAGATTDIYADVIRPGMELALRLGRDTLNAVKDAAVEGIRAVGTVVSYAAQAGSRAYHAVTRAAAVVGHAVVHAVKSTWHAVKKAATATVSFVKHRAALITSIVVGAVVFAGCEAATAGVGTVGCAALAGAAANMASYAVTAAQTGHFSVTGFLMAGVTDAVTGALTGGLLEGASGLAGGLLSSGTVDGATSMADGAVAEAADTTTESAAGTADASARSTADDTAARSGAAEDVNVARTGSEVAAANSRAPQLTLDEARAAAERQGLDTRSHTCDFEGPGMTGDHQPSSGFGPPNTPRNLFPQCPTCVRIQTRAVLIGQQILRNHGWYNPNAPGAYEFLMSILDNHIE
jgi:hypothetical protein